MKNEDLPQYHLASVDHALHILLLLKSKSCLRVSEVAEELGVARSTAHRLLSTLVYRGFAAQDAARLYRPGPVLVEVGMAALGRLEVRQQARPALERLAKRSGETSSLMLLEGGDSRFIDSIESGSPVRVGSRAGVTLPAHLTSGGKAMLAALPERSLLSLYPDEMIPAAGYEVVVRRRDLVAELAQVREVGYAVNAGQTSEGVLAVGAALCGSDGLPIAALTVAGPMYRMTSDKTTEAGRLVLRAVAEFDKARFR